MHNNYSTNDKALCQGGDSSMLNEEKKYSDDCIDYAREYLYKFKEKEDIFTKRLDDKEKEDGRERNNYERDYARVLYSSSFRRLQGKMQLLGIRSDSFYRNRLTHSLEVSQIARGIANKLGYEKEDIFVVETCSLAHDLGNPPFGHYGEKILNKLSADIGGFEGNAQTIRILMNLEKKKPNIEGLNLTLRTLLGVIKYYNKSDEGKEKFIYTNNYEKLLTECESAETYPRTIDVQIIDIADEIAYAAHDLEDALSLKLFNIDELLYELNISKYKGATDKFKEIIDEAKTRAKSGNKYKSSEEFTFLFNKELTSIIVNQLINDIELINVGKEHINTTGTKCKKELGFKKLEDLAKGLKKTTFRCINRSDTIQIYEKTGEKILNGLYEVFTDKKYNSDYKFLPVEYRPNKDMCECNKRRLIIDYIAGMMDSYAISTYEKFFGKSSLEIKYFNS